MRKTIGDGLRKFADRIAPHYEPAPPPIKRPSDPEKVTVVVNGVPVVIRVHSHEKLAELIRLALIHSGVKGVGSGRRTVVDIAWWELRNETGELLASTSLANEGKGSNERIAEVGVKDGDTVFLGPEVGGGGNVDSINAEAVA